MTDSRYYFSTNGTNNYGPVTVAALRQLFSDRAIGPGSFLRGENETELQPLNPEFFAPPVEGTGQTEIPITIARAVEPAGPRSPVEQMPPAPTPAVGPPEQLQIDLPDSIPEPVVTKPVVSVAPSVEVQPTVLPPDTAPAPTPSSTEKPTLAEPAIPPLSVPPGTSAPEHPREVSAFSIAAVVLGFAVAIWLTERTATPRDFSHNGSYTIGACVGRIVFLILVPRLISWLFARRLRPLVFLIGVVGFSLLIFAAQPKDAVDTARISAAAQSLQERTKREAQEQLKTRGYFEQDPSEAVQEVQKLKDSVGPGDSDTARMSRAFLIVVGELLERTKNCDQLGKACDFDALTITGLDDIARRKAAIGKLHLAQQDVVNYLQNIDGRCRELLLKDNFNEFSIEQAVAGFHQSGHVTPLISLWQAQAQLSVNHIARLDFLARGWGTWTIKDGQLQFPDNTSLNAYNDSIHAIQADVQNIGNAQKQIYK